jgi:hypothetical protein
VAVAALKSGAGDFVIIQFGHNDSGAVNQEPPGSTKPLRARGTIPGIGNESEEIDNVITGKHETVYSFGWYLRKMIADTRAKGATPILLTLTKTNSWKDGRIPCDTETYRLWTWQTAKARKPHSSTSRASSAIASSAKARTRSRHNSSTTRAHQPHGRRSQRAMWSRLCAPSALPLRKMLSRGRACRWIAARDPTRCANSDFGYLVKRIGLRGNGADSSR